MTPPGQPMVLDGGKYDDLAVIFIDTPGHGRLAYSLWKLSWWERIVALLNGEVGIYQIVGNRRLQPQFAEVEFPSKRAYQPAKPVKPEDPDDYDDTYLPYGAAGF